MHEKVVALTSSLRLSDDQLMSFKAALGEEMKKGLAKATNSDADIKMLPTYVTKLPTGKECGKFLALDLGGTNFRVLLVSLNHGQVEIESEKFRLTEEIITGSGIKLFDQIASYLTGFVSKQNLKGEKLPLGFTFSFPCHQEDLVTAKLIKWTKGFTCDGVVDHDAALLLQDAIARQKIQEADIKVMAVANDTVGVLMSTGYNDPACRIGVIVGTGTNACYFEKLENIEMVDASKCSSNEMVINMEWGPFGDNGALNSAFTKYDRQMDKSFFNTGHRIFEKLISGKYLGELVRVMLVDLAAENLLFNGQIPQILLNEKVFGTEYISFCEEGDEGNIDNTRKVLTEKMGIKNVSDEDCMVIRYVCKIVSTRAAQLLACGLSAVLEKMAKDNVTIGFDGSVIKCHPHYLSILKEKLQELTPNLTFKMQTAEDGSGLGAAVLVAAASQ